MGTKEKVGKPDKFLIGTSVGFLILIVIVCTLPFFFTQFSWVDFTETGQIGDTIGGIMGPFMAIVGAVLTFLAFWVQYQANQEQKLFLMNQEKKHEKEAFERKLYSLIESYEKTRNSLSIDSLKNEKLFEELCYELCYIYKLVKKAFEGSDNVLFKQIHSETEVNSFLLDWSYSLFFYGKINWYENKNIDKSVIASVESQVLNVISVHRDIPEAELTYREIIEDESLKIDEPNYYRFKHPHKLGHKGLLGSYFRQMYQVIVHIDNADSELITDSEKYEYAKLLRVKMSESEQIILYYNSLSHVGKEWGRIRKDSNGKGYSYISRYKMVKNIPYHFPYFGIHPVDCFHKEIIQWKDDSLNAFFEDETFLWHNVPDNPVV